MYKVPMPILHKCFWGIMFISLIGNIYCFGLRPKTQVATSLPVHAIVEQVREDIIVLSQGPYGEEDMTSDKGGYEEQEESSVELYRDRWEDTRFGIDYDQLLTGTEKDVLRAQRYGVRTNPKRIAVRQMKNNQVQDSVKLHRTIEAVLPQLPHVRTTPNLVQFVMEIFMAETCLGQYTTGSGQYGLAQFRSRSATHLLNWTKTIHPDVYESLMSFYNNELSLKDNLISNIPFNIAMCATYFWHRVPDYQERITSVEERAILWKTVYNTRSGKGIVSKYLARIEYAVEKRYVGFTASKEKEVQKQAIPSSSHSASL